MNILGQIISISEVQTFDSGAKKLSFQIDTKEQYNNIISFDLFKGVKHVKHVDDFLQHNKIGDQVDVEFNIQCKEYEGKWYTNLNVWKLEKVTGAIDPDPAGEETDDDSDGLPF